MLDTQPSKLLGLLNKSIREMEPLDYHSDFIIMVPQNDEWAKLIEKVYAEKAKKVIRYAIKKEANIFDEEKLKSIVSNLGSDYELRLIDKETYDSTKMNKWSSDLCSQFDSFDSYNKNGLGVVALHNGEVVSGASSYTAYRHGIEIEIDTREDYRRKGLALACGAEIILECINRNLYPSWDAQNKGSVALAENLGYHFDKEYIAYEVNGFGTK